jgi:hypothetical protein
MPDVFYRDADSRKGYLYLQPLRNAIRYGKQKAGVFMNIAIKWKHADKWHELPVADIAHMPRTHALNLLARPIPVTIRQDDIMISNQLDIRNIYRKRGHKVYKLEDCRDDERSLAVAGFV